MKKTKKSLYAMAIFALIMTSFSCKDKKTTATESIEPDVAQAEPAEEIQKEAPELFNMITVEGDWFTLGLTEDEIEKIDNDSRAYRIYRKHETYVSDFLMSSSEITQDMYEEIMEANPSIHASKYRPVELKKFTDALIFCNKLSIKENLTPCYSVKGETDPDLWDLYWGKETKDFYSFMKNLACDFNADGYRLPTEAEWMYAARSGTHHDKFKYSGADSFFDVAVSSGSDGITNIGYDSPAEVKSMKPNSLGFYDMSGNLPEIVWDYYAPFPEYKTVDYKGPERRDSTYADFVIIKGCGFKQAKELETRDYTRLDHEYEIDYYGSGFGFRVCRSINSEDSQKRTKKALEIAKKDQEERLKETVISKLVKVKPFAHRFRSDIDYKRQFDGLYITKEPIEQNDFYLLSDKYAGDYIYIHNSTTYNAIRFLNEISRICGYEPYYKITMPDENGEYAEVDEEYLVSHNLDFMISYNDYDDWNKEGFKGMKIACNPKANGFRFPKEDDFDYERRSEERDEEESLSYLTDTNYGSNVSIFLKNGLPADMRVEHLKEKDGFVKDGIYYGFGFSKFYICKNIPEDKKELVKLEKTIADYSSKLRIKKLDKFEALAGTSINKLMKNVKGGKALQSLDTQNKDFVEVTLGSFVMSEIPVTQKIYTALEGKKFTLDGDGYRRPTEEDIEEASNRPKEFSWYDAAAFCNALSELYNYQKAYSFYRDVVTVDYTANGFRMPTEAEWEHAARSGTTDKSLKYGVTIDSVVYYGNPAMYTLRNNDWEDYYEPEQKITVYTGKANSLGIYNLAGLCYEWCNDFQYFDYDDFCEQKTGYTISSYDSKPYYITKMPFGQIYAPQKIQKGSDKYNRNASDVKLSVRRTSREKHDGSALRLVRTTKPDEMKKLLEEHEKEHIEMLTSQKSFFDENLKMVGIKGQEICKVDDYGRIDEEKRLTLSDYELSDTEITNEMFIRIMHYNPNIEHTESKYYNDSPKAPVTNLTYTEARYFCNELSKVYGYKPFYNIEEETVNEDSDGFRLPTKNEWRFAAMEANPKSKLEYSGSNDKDEVGVFDAMKPQDVKSKKPNKLGLYDMSGNAAEMVHSVSGYRDYYWNTDNIMGGSYDTNDDVFYGERNWHESNYKEETGFRVARNGKRKVEN